MGVQTTSGTAAQALPAEVGGAGMWRQGWRLCMSWWPGRGQTEEHPVIQRLLAAAGSSSSSSGGGGSSGTSTANEVAAPVAEATVAGADEQQQQQQQQQPQQAVLLFCRAGGGPYAFCGRLRLAEAAPNTSSSGNSSGSGSSRAGLAGDGSLCWELVDAPAMLSGEAGGTTFAQLLFT